MTQIDSPIRGDGLAGDSSWREVHHVSGCDAVFSPAVNVLVWRRTLAPDLAALVEQGIHPGESWREIVALGEDERMRPTAAVERLPPTWRREIAMLAELLCMLTGGTGIGIRWEIARKATCPRFHFDRTTLRLVSTYRGQGTQWVDERDVERPACAGIPRQERWPDLVRKEACIRGAREGDVVLLKGDLWPGNAGRAAVHRSPPVDPGPGRLLLTLDIV